eukprot:1562678-Prymnesium_polylepis.2
MEAVSHAHHHAPPDVICLSAPLDWLSKSRLRAPPGQLLSARPHALSDGRQACRASQVQSPSGCRRGRKPCSICCAASGRLP